MKKKDKKALEINEVEAAEAVETVEETVEAAEETVETAVEEVAEPEVVEEAAEVITEEAAEIPAEAPVVAAAAGKTTLQKIFCLRNILIAVGVVVVALAAFITIYILNHGTSGPDKAAEKYVQAIIDRDGKAANKVMCQAAKNQIFGYTDGEKQAKDAKIEKNMPKYFKTVYADASNWTITGTKVIQKTDSQKTLDELQKNHDETFGNGTKDKIGEVAVVRVNVKNKKTGEKIKLDVYCVRLGIRWYVYNPAAQITQ